MRPPTATARSLAAPISPPIGIALIVSAVAVLAGGAIHAHEWLVLYRHVPALIPGSAVVRVGFPLNAAMSLVVGGAIVITTFRARRLAPAVIVGALVFQATSLASLILSRTGSVFGWTEMFWTPAANRTRIVEIAALLALSAAGAALAAQRLTAATTR
jgi:hypothetical protein